jgi:methionyl-tRNA formyltransferase
MVAVLTQPDRPRGHGRRPKPSAVKTLAAEHGIPVLQPETLRAPEAQAAIATLDLDALIVVAYGLLLPQAVLDLPTYGCLNVHGSLLPRWRGAAPIQRAIEAGDRESGITIMQMEAGLDTGPMLALRAIPIAPTATSATLYAQLAELGPTLLLEVLADLPGHLAGARAQDDAEATYAHKISKAEAVVDWSLPAAALARHIRALNPAPGCYSLLDGERVKIWMAQAAPTASGGAPGVIQRADAQGIVVACGDGDLLIENLQLPGARAMAAADLLRGKAALFAVGKAFDAAPAP